MKKISIIFLFLSLIVLSSCGSSKCTEHIDNNDDFVCDLCDHEIMLNNEIEIFIENEKRYFYFGEYPKSRVTDSELIIKLSYQTPDENNCIILDNNKYYKLLKVVDSNSIETYYFLFEPLKWSVLSKSEDFCIAWTNDIIDGCAYSKNNSFDYELSTVRSYLNNDMIDLMFTKKEKRFLQKSEVKNNGIPLETYSYVNKQFIENVDPDKGKFASSNTNDYLYILSYEELFKLDYGFNDVSPYEVNSRKALLTEYAFTKLWDSTTSLSMQSFYLTRTPYSATMNGYGNRVYGVYDNGQFAEVPLTYSSFGLRPVIKVKL